MKEIHAQELMRSFMALGDSINAIAEKIENIEIEEDKKRFRKAISEIMGTLYIDLMLPIIREHPQLDPDKTL